MRYAYYPGCFLHGSAKEYEISTRAICRALGIELVEIEDWNCCGALEVASDKILSTALSIRNIILASKLGMDLIAPCSICYNNLLKADYSVKESQGVREKIEGLIGEPYRAEVKIKHLINVIIQEYGLDNLAGKVKKPLKGIRAAPYYGCLLTRPARICKAEDPMWLENIIRAIGGEYIEFPSKTKCCGGALLMGKEETANKLAKNLLEEAKKLGANCLIVACPLCHTMLDAQQSKIETIYKTKFTLPVLYFTQAIGLALGLDMRETGLDKHFVSPKLLQ
ncbi:MAG: CoB--CoM heterodisulfide reductase iron-sulfur subunit B family protein [Methanocellales archaeon]